MQILGLCGSLRARSSNLSVLEAMKSLCPPEWDFRIYGGLSALPLFNPDLDGVADVEAHPQVAAFRSALQGAEAVVISSPEYAHSLPGALKNALDWVVGSGELSGKPVAIVTASELSQHVKPVLTEILTAMDARVVEESSITVPGIGRALSAEQVIAQEATAVCLRNSIRKLIGRATRLSK